MENQQHLLTFAGKSEKSMRPFKKGTVLSHRHSGSKIIELLQSNLIADFRLKITSSWVLCRFLAAGNRCSSAGFWHEGRHPSESACKAVRKDPSILKATCRRTAFSCPWWHQPACGRSLAFMQIVISFRSMHPGRNRLLFSCMVFSATGNALLSKSKQFAAEYWLFTGVAVLCKHGILGDGACLEFSLYPDS